MYSQLNIFLNVLLFQPFVAPVPTFFENCSRHHLKIFSLNICYVIYVLLWIKYRLLRFESLLVFILFKFISNQIIFHILNKKILWLMCLYELLLEYSFHVPALHVIVHRWFSTPVLGSHCSAHFVFLPYLMHLIQIISSLGERSMN